MYAMLHLNKNLYVAKKFYSQKSIFAKSLSLISYKTSILDFCRLLIWGFGVPKFKDGIPNFKDILKIKTSLFLGTIFSCLRHNFEQS